MRRLLTENHEPRSSQLKHVRRALRLTRSLVRSGIVQRLDEVDELGRRYVLPAELPHDFALNQPLSHFALAALELLDPEDPSYALDVISVIEAVLEAPRTILFAQQRAVRGEAIGEMKADGVEYDDRMRQIEDITWPQPLAELLGAAFETYRQGHPWLPEDALGPKSVVREMYEQAMGFNDFISRYQLARSEGLLLRYLTDTFRTLRQTVPEAARTEELTDLEHWLGEVIRQVDSSLLDEWTALSNPDAVIAERAEPEHKPVPLSRQERALRVMVRTAMFLRVQHAAFDRVNALVTLEAAAAAKCDPPREVLIDREAWDTALDAYFDEHETLLTDGDARGPAHLRIEVGEGPQPGGDDDVTARLWSVRQVLADPAEHHDWVIDAVVDLDATDESGELVMLTTAMHRLG